MSENQPRLSGLKLIEVKHVAPLKWVTILRYHDGMWECGWIDFDEPGDVPRYLRDEYRVPVWMRLASGSPRREGVRWVVFQYEG